MSLAEALDAESFKAKEIEAKGNSNIAFVLMSASTLQDFKKAYLNYFWDTKAFIANIEKNYVINK